LVTSHRSFNGHHKYPNTFAAGITIKAPPRYVLRIISNFRLKPAWMQGMTNVYYDTTKANRMGMSYKCNLNHGQIDIQTVQSFIGDQIEYVEKISNFRVFPNALLFFYLTATDAQHTYLALKFHYSRVVKNRFFYFYMGRRMKLFLGKSLRNLKSLCERMYEHNPR
jgi:hypothetical protein